MPTLTEMQGSHKLRESSRVVVVEMRSCEGDLGRRASVTDWAGSPAEVERRRKSSLIAYDEDTNPKVKSVRVRSRSIGGSRGPCRQTMPWFKRCASAYRRLSKGRAVQPLPSAGGRD